MLTHRSVIEATPLTSALDRRQGGFWPWQENPYALISFSDMLRLSVAALLNTMRRVSDAKHLLGTRNLVGADTRTERQRLGEELRAMQEAVRALPLARSLDHQIERLVGSMDRDVDIITTLTTEVETNVHYELDAWSFYAVRPDRKEYYENPGSFFDVATLLAFPDSEADILAAGRCFALDEWTACVFHLMRAVESALRAWSTQLGATTTMPASEANFQQLINAVQRKLSTLEQQPRTEQRARDLRYFGETASHFNAIKNAWRNHVMHSKAKYDEREAKESLQSVAAFMRACAARPSADPEPPKASE